MAAGWALLVGVFASVSQLFGPEEDRGTWGDVVGAVVGNFVTVFVLALVVSAIVRVAGVSEPAPTPHPPHARMMRRFAIGGVLGGLPGWLIALVPLLLHGFGVISSDQSQIGLVGTLTAASDSGRTGQDRRRPARHVPLRTTRRVGGGRRPSQSHEDRSLRLSARSIVARAHTGVTGDETSCA